MHTDKKRELLEKDYRCRNNANKHIRLLPQYDLKEHVYMSITHERYMEITIKIKG